MSQFAGLSTRPDPDQLFARTPSVALPSSRDSPVAEVAAPTHSTTPSKAGLGTVGTSAGQGARSRQTAQANQTSSAVAKVPPPVSAAAAVGPASPQRWSAVGLDWPGLRTDTESGTFAEHATRPTAELSTTGKAKPTEAAAANNLGSGDPHGHIGKLHPIMQNKVRQLLHNASERKLLVSITQGMRTIAEQDALYAKGRTAPGSIVTKAKGGKSYHNYGLAVDLAFQGKDPYGERNNWQGLGAAGKAAGLDWGGEFKSIKDRPHFQLPGLSLAGLQKWYAQGGMKQVWAGVSAKAGPGKKTSPRRLAAKTKDGGGSSVAAPQGGSSSSDVAKNPQPVSAKVLGSAGQALGNFLITHYTFALESDPVHASSPQVAAPGLAAGARYRQSFLWSNKGIKMQGTGLAEDGKYIMWAGGKFAYGMGGRFRSPKPWRSIAVDPKVIPPSSQVAIDAYPGKGPFSADDTGGAIKGQHIDVFAGAVTIAEAYKLGKLRSEVRLLSGSEPARPSATTGGRQTAAPPGQGRPAPALDQVRAGTARLQRGDVGEAVRRIQQLLGAKADGSFGQKTEDAARTFQAGRALKADGIVGQRTLAALEANCSRTPGLAAGLGGAKVAGGALAKKEPHAEPGQGQQGAQQMAKLVSVARNIKSPGGHCYAAVKRYIKAAGGYGNIKDVYADKRLQPQGEAHDFHDCVQRLGPDAFGLEQVAAATPFDAPEGALVIVKHGSPGTHHPTAGDITVRGQGIDFYNDGVMHYRGPKAWPPKKGGLLGVYKPKTTP